MTTLSVVLQSILVKTKDVVLVAPNTLGSYKFKGKNRENLALGVLSAYLSKEKISSKIIDARLEHLSAPQVLNELIRLQPKIVGLTLMGQESALWSKDLTELLRQAIPQVHIVAGSYFPTLETRKCFTLIPKLNSIIQGEGEETLVELFLKIKNQSSWYNIQGLAFRRGKNFVVNPRRQLIKDLDNLPFPIRYAAAEKISKVSLEGSRGCFARCTFCSVGPHTDPIWSMWRGKSPSRIVEELIELRKIYPDIDQFRFVDDDFIGSGSNFDRIEQLVDDLSDAGFSLNNTKLFFETQSKNVVSIPKEVWKKFHKVGLYQVFMGIETASDRIKEKMLKPSDTNTDFKAFRLLKESGINTAYSIIMLTPWSDMNDVLKNVEMLRYLGDAGLDKYFSEMILTPGTKAYEMVDNENKIYLEEFEGLGYYSYPLPNSLESLRRVGRFMLKTTRLQSFLEEITSIYTQISALRLRGQPELAKRLRQKLDQVNLDIFMKVVKSVGMNQLILSDSQIENLCLKMIPSFESKLSSIQNQLITN